MVSVSLPSSSALYTRRGSIIAINNSTADSENNNSSNNNNSNNLSTTIKSSVKLSLISNTFPFISNKIVSSEPATILLTSAAVTTPAGSSFSNTGFIGIGGNNDGSASQSVVISPTKNFDWVIPNRDSILAWTCQGFTASNPGDPASAFISDKYGSIRVKGISPDPTSPINPQVAVCARTGSGPVLEIKLLENETIYLHPNSILAYTVESNLKKINESFIIIPHDNNNNNTSSSSNNTTSQIPNESSELSKPSATPSTSIIGKYFNFSKSSSSNSSSSLFSIISQYFNSSKALLHKWLYKGDDILLKVQGPKTILIASGDGNSSARALDPPSPTQLELEQLLKESSTSS